MAEPRPDMNITVAAFTVSEKSNNTSCLIFLSDETTGCGGILNDNEGMIQSTEEMRGELCVWVIVAPERSKIDLAISNVDLDSSDTCGRSYIKVARRIGY